MSTPSLYIDPDMLKAGKLYSQLPPNGSGDFTVVRNTIANRTNASGVLSSVAANVPRLDYPIGGGCPSLLVEPAATNLLLRSEEFNNAYWSAVRINAFGSGSIANAAVAPNGTTTADYIQQLAGETNPGGAARIGISVTSGTVYTLSVFAKQSDNRFLRLGFALGAGGGALFCNFDLQTGTIGTPAAGIVPSIQNFGNGWYRCSITATSQVTAVANQFIYQANGINSTTATPNTGIFIWGAQLETGSVATSYIQTVATTQTRNADVISLTSASALIGQTQGTLYAEVSLRAFGEQRTFVSIMLNSNSRDFINLQISSSNLLFARMRNQGGSLVDVTASNVIIGTVKLAAAYSAGNLTLAVNGTIIGTNTNANINFTNALNSIGLGHGPLNQTDQQPANFLNDRIRAAALYKTRLPNAELQALTTL